MLSKVQILDAVRYNSRQASKLWRITQLPELLREGVNSEFVAWVCVYQAVEGLKVDGKLGPTTFEKIRKDKAKEDITTSIRVSKPPSVVVDGKSPSNCIIINGKRIAIPQEMIDAGYIATNYLDDGEPRFSHKRRRHALNHFVLHETCGSTAEGCENTLKRKGYGVQLIMDPWGRISCHGDLVLDQMVHANQLNKSSFGMEVVNPYNPIYVRKKDEALWSKRIPRQWWTWVPKGAPKEYVCPTDDQMACARILVPWVTKVTGLFPYEFPTSGKRKKIKHPNPGIVAHRDFAGHSDGRYMLEDLISRAEQEEDDEM